MDELLIEQIEKYLHKNYKDYIRFSVNLRPNLLQRIKEYIDSLFKSPPETFSQRLLKLIDEKGKTDVEIYKAAHIDRRLFSKIRSDKNYKPSKKTAVSLAIALELNKDEARDLVKRAGYYLSYCIKEDVIVLYFLETQKYDLNLINEVLEYYGLPQLGKDES